MTFTSSVPTNVRTPVAVTEYLAKRFTYHSAEDWVVKIREGRVRVNDETCGEDDTVKAGDVITYEPASFEEPEADLSYSIIYEDEWMFAVDKPANLLVHRAGKSFINNLSWQLRNAHVPPYPTCSPVHRLDRDTSGIVIFAKDAKQMAEFGRLFNEGRIVKKYKAVVRGCPNVKTPYTIDAPIAREVRDDGLIRYIIDSAGKSAVTIIEDIRQLDKDYSLLSITPVTGRTHQIRVHLSSIGFPIAGDKVYGYADKRFARQALHCESLSFIHPHTNDLCVITADYNSLIKIGFDPT